MESKLLARVIGEHLVSLRWKRSIRQKELATRSKISVRTLRMIEKGQVEVSAYTLRKIVLALDEDMPAFWYKVEKIMAVMEKNKQWFDEDPDMCQKIDNNVKAMLINKKYNNKNKVKSCGGYKRAIIF